MRKTKIICTIGPASYSRDVMSGLITTDDYGRTTRAGVFASGDVVTGAKIVVQAVRVCKK